MVSVVDAILGGVLNQGAKMETSSALKEWMAAHNWTLASSGVGSNEKSMQGEFMTLSSNQQSVGGIKTNDSTTGNFEALVRGFKTVHEKQVGKTSEFEKSAKIAGVGKLMCQPDKQKLLGLALSTTSGVPLRYCIKNEILAAAKYWTFQADQLNFHDVHSNQDSFKTVAVLVASNNPVLMISRTIAPLISTRSNIVLVPDDDSIALVCAILADIINQAGFDCGVYRAGNPRLKELVALDNVDWIVCGNLSHALGLRNFSLNLKLDLDGKKAVVAMETGDCDAAVDAALHALKTSGRSAAGLYLIVQDSLLEDITWRMKDRLKSSCPGDVLDSTTDFSDGQEFKGPQPVLDYFQSTKLDVIQVGNARVVFNAQPSLPLAQWDRIGQTLLIMSYRTVPELVTLLGNLASLNELSLWVDHQATAWQVINQAQTSRIWVNGASIYEPGFDELTSIKLISSKLPTIPDGKTNVGIYSLLDGLRTAQRSWTSQPTDQKRQLILKVLKQLIAQNSSQHQQAELMDLIQVIQRLRDTVSDASSKSSVVFDLTISLGVIAVIDAGEVDKLSQLIRLILLAVLKGNGVVINSNNPATLDFVKMAKDAGLPIFVSPNNDENNRALVKHRGVRLLILLGPVALPILEEYSSAGVWECDGKEDQEEIVRMLTKSKRVWMAIGDGLAN